MFETIIVNMREFSNLFQYLQTLSPNLFEDIDAKQNIAGDKEDVTEKLLAPPSSDVLSQTLLPKTGDETGIMEAKPLRDDNSFEERKIGKKG